MNYIDVHELYDMHSIYTDYTSGHLYRVVPGAKLG